MNHDDEHRAADDAGPCALGLLVGTLALMTAHAAPEPGANVDADTQRRLMARKIVSNLYFLRCHPDAPPPLRRVAETLHARWWPLAHQGGGASASPVSSACGPTTAPAGTQWH